MRLLSPFLSLFFFVMTVSAQQSTMQPCGTSKEDQFLMKARAQTHKRNATALLNQLRDYSALRNNPDSINYVPVQIHICGEDNGNGYISISKVLATICKLNEDFESQAIQFYIYNVNYISNNLLYNHGNNAGNPTALYLMSLYKVNGLMNLFIGREVTAADQFLAYYTSSLDVIYTFKAGVGANNPTLTHEVGHFFTLPHTFFGWEGTSYNLEKVNNHAPATVGGHPVEKTLRAGPGENCQLAGDGFCDTAPDYGSDRNPCIHNLQWHDPDSIFIDPDESNFMSYFDDNCLSSFSPEQETAILADFISRGYYQFPRPSPLYTNSAPSIHWPRTGAVAHYNNNIPLRWSKVDSATMYLVTLYRSINNGAVLLFVDREILCTDTTYTLSLPQNLEYTWNVKALTNYDLCNNNRSPNETFRSADWALSVSNTETTTLEVNIYPNPTQRNSQALSIEIQSPKAQECELSLYDMQGQIRIKNVKLLLNNGTNRNLININTLDSGTYIIKLTCLHQNYYKKLIISE